MNSMPSIAMRATQKNKMSKPVMSRLGGENLARSGVWSGQPRVEKGQRPLLNQVSSTSVSWRSLAEPHCGHVLGSSRATVMCLFSQYQAGTRWPHQSWCEMHQSRMLYIHSL